MSILDKESKQLINAARLLGNNGFKIFLEDNQLVRLIAVIAVDLELSHLIEDYVDLEGIANGYYGTSLEWFNQPIDGVYCFEEIFAGFKNNVADFSTYFKCMCELHKRRMKFDFIISNQAIPRMEQIVPRCLLEYGMQPSETLASWLVWRKWLYDIDNRAAQETGYLFEPILTSSIGGKSFSASKSPVKRASDPRKGRQVDCIEGRNAYEFKMRVTIAASGQGRFKEELDFARDCHHSGFAPVLLVLDSTPSIKLDELIDEFKKYDGEAYIGEDAWLYMESRAGAVMGRFIEKYVRTPVREVDLSYQQLHAISLQQKENTIELRIGEQIISIFRSAETIQVDDELQIEE